MMEWHPVFVAGKARIRVSFTGGHLCSGGNTAASYETDDPVVQKVIENSAQFRSGKIRNVRRNAPLSMQKENNPGGESGNELKEMKFATIGQAEDFLTREKGVSPLVLVSDDATLRTAESLGIKIVIENRE